MSQRKPKYIPHLMLVGMEPVVSVQVASEAQEDAIRELLAARVERDRLRLVLGWIGQDMGFDEIGGHDVHDEAKRLAGEQDPDEATYARAYASVILRAFEDATTARKAP